MTGTALLMEDMTTLPCERFRNEIRCTLSEIKLGLAKNQVRS
jgi:hypothetical protein